MGDETSYSLILQFDEQDPKFTYGFQAGVIWAMTKTGEPFVEQFCGENLELIQRMQSRTNYRFNITGGEHGWYTLEAVPKEDV